MAKVYLYGKLRQYLPEEARHEGCIELDLLAPETLSSILTSLGIEVDQLATIFINAKLLATRNSMASSLQYRQLRSSPHDWDLNIDVNPGDRVGIFGMDMPALVV